jgi:hypothetical protein
MNQKQTRESMFVIVNETATSAGVNKDLMSLAQSSAVVQNEKVLIHGAIPVQLLLTKAEGTNTKRDFLLRCTVYFRCRGTRPKIGCDAHDLLNAGT